MNGAYFCVYDQLESLRMLTEIDEKYILDGKEMMTLSQFYEQIIKRLDFPADFGRNLDALYDSLSDLSWLPEQNIKLVFENTSHLLKNETADTRANVILTMYDAAESFETEPLFEDEDSKELVLYFQQATWLEDMMEEHMLIWKFVG